MPPHNREMPTSVAVFPVLATTSYRGTIGDILSNIRAVHSSLPDYDDQIDLCFVTRVGHHRSTSKNSHELVALTMDYSLSDGTKETRYVRLDRTRNLKQDQGSLPAASRDAVDVASTSCQSFESNDSVHISDHLVEGTHGIMGKDYQLIRTFEVRSDTLRIIDALVLADTLSKMFERYTLHVQMCQFWAANLVLILKAVVEHEQGGNVTIVNGPAFDLAGKFRGIQMVDIQTGKALFGKRDADLKKLFRLPLISQETRTEVDKLRAIPTGGPIVAVVAEASASNNDLTANKVYRNAQEAAKELREQIKATLTKILRRNAEIVQRSAVPAPHNPAP